MSSRNAAVNKISGSKFTPNKARAQQIDEQDENCQTARQAKNNAKRIRLSDINPNISARAPFLIPEATTAKVVEAASSTEQPSKRVTRSQTKRAVETEKPALEIESKNSNKENESFAPQGFVFTAPKAKEIVVKDMKFQDSILVHSTKSNLPSRTPIKRTSVGAESEDNIKISPLIFNNPWISTTRGSSSKNFQVSDFEKEFARLVILKDSAWVCREDVPEVNKKPDVKGSGKWKSLKRSVLFNLAKNSVFTVIDAIPEEPAEFTPSHKKTFGRRVENVVESLSPEKHLFGAVDAVKSGTECFDRVTPLKVFPFPPESKPTNRKSKVLPLDNTDPDEPAPQEIPTLRRSARLRALNSRPDVSK